MSDEDASMARWHDAAALASFTIYEAGDASDRWAGGFSSNGDRIEVITVVAGHEVSVESSRAEGTELHDVRRRLAIGNMLARHVLDRDDEVVLPYSVTVEGADRSVTIDGEEHVIAGIRITGHPRWLGTVQVGDVSVTITTASPAQLSLRRGENWSSRSSAPVR